MRVGLVAFPGDITLGMGASGSGFPCGTVRVTDGTLSLPRPRAFTGCVCSSVRGVPSVRVGLPHGATRWTACTEDE